MTKDDLPEGDHVVRYVKPSMIQEDGTADGSDFRLRPARPDETSLSVNWLEILGSEKIGQLSAVRGLSRLRMRSTGRFAELQVGAVLRKVAEEWESLRIVHDPLDAEDDFDADPSHSEIIGLPPGDSDQAILVGDLIAECVVEMHPAIAD